MVAMDTTQFAQLLSEAINEALKPRDSRALILRLGLADGRPRTLLEVAEELGVSRQRGRQIVVKGFRALPRVCFDQCRRGGDSAPARLLLFARLSLVVPDEPQMTKLAQFAEEFLPSVPLERYALPLLINLVSGK